MPPFGRLLPATSPARLARWCSHDRHRNPNHEVGEAFRYGNALTMAIEDLGKPPCIEEEDQVSALSTLAFDLCSATEKIRAQWRELFELSRNL